MVKIKKENLNILLDTKDYLKEHQLKNLQNSLLNKQLQPLLVCIIDDKYYILDGAVRYNVAPYNFYFNCIIIEDILDINDAIERWFEIHNTFDDNILKVSKIVSELNNKNLHNIYNICKFTNDELNELILLQTYDFDSFINKNKKIKQHKFNFYEN